MKKYTVSLLIVSFLLALTGCGGHAEGQTSAAETSSNVPVSSAAVSVSSAPQDPKASAEQAAILKEMSKVLNADFSVGSVTQSSDTHEQEDGDGLTFCSVQFADEQLTKAIETGENWHSLPLSESLTVLAYGMEMESEDEDEAEEWEEVETVGQLEETSFSEDADMNVDEADGDEEDDGDLIFEEDDNISVDPPIFEEPPDADDLEDGVTPVIVGEDGNPEDAEAVETIGPFLVDKNNEPLIPEIKNGSYFFLDRHPDSPDPQSDEEILNRDSMHITLAVYDADNHTLYYCAFDDTLED